MPARPVAGIEVVPAVAVPVVLAGRPAVAVDPAVDDVVVLLPLVPPVLAGVSTAPLFVEESSLEHAPVINKTHVSHSARCFMSRHPRDC
jgi:hypothetical protein